FGPRRGGASDRRGLAGPIRPTAVGRVQTSRTAIRDGVPQASGLERFPRWWGGFCVAGLAGPAAETRRTAPRGCHSGSQRTPTGPHPTPTGPHPTPTGPQPTPTGPQPTPTGPQPTPHGTTTNPQHVAKSR